MSDTALITETILDADGLDCEAFARLYSAWVRTEAIFGTVPVEVEDATDRLTVTIHDPTATVAGERGDDDIQHIRDGGPDELFGVPPNLSQFDGNAE